MGVVVVGAVLIHTRSLSLFKQHPDGNLQKYIDIILYIKVPSHKNNVASRAFVY
jgi:hypothetical protein